ncbi:hypothetical protein TNCV_1022381 [Trichonephila clavipes]|nr:hypothetical protein TNCV_1022381 [Trichonephila clavipes]
MRQQDPSSQQEIAHNDDGKTFQRHSNLLASIKCINSSQNQIRNLGTTWHPRYIQHLQNQRKEKEALTFDEDTHARDLSNFPAKPNFL